MFNALAIKRKLAIFVALAASFQTSLRTVQGKYVNLKHGYGPFYFSIDTGILTAFTLLILWLYFFFIAEHNTFYTRSDTIYSLLGSFLTLFWGLAGLY